MNDHANKDWLREQYEPNRFVGAIWFLFKCYVVVGLIISIVNYEWWT